MRGIYEHLVPEDLDPVPVHVYEHPDWDMKLILPAESNSRQAALDNLGDPCPRCGVRRDGLTHLDESLLTVTETTMPREEFVNLQEFDG